MGRAKSAMFFPLYIDNIYIGYWIIESSEIHAFDAVDINILEIIKDNIVTILKTTSYQNTIENINRIDKTTGLDSAEYLYGKGKRLIDKHSESTVCMFNVINIEKINEVFGRNVGTGVIIKLSNIVKKNISSDYIFVRYMGPKFVIVFPGAVSGSTETFVKAIKEEIERIKIGIASDDKKENKNNKKDNSNKKYVPIKTNFVLASYFKGTGIEEVTKKLEEYLDECDDKESNINCI